MKRLHLFVFGLIFGLNISFAQQATTSSNSKRMVMPYAVAFYNLENLFDTINANGTYDLEYSPQGVKKWNTDKYTRKLDNMAYVLSRLGKEICPMGPAVIGVSEVENRSVLEDLLKTGDLAKQNLQIVHYDSPDRRGVDAALLYNPALFHIESSRPILLEVEGKPNFRTRDLLLVTGTMANERFHILVNHWPSRGNDELYRIAAARLNKAVSDSLRAAEPESKIIIMGDLNDDPNNVSLIKELQAKPKRKSVSEKDLFNPMAEIFAKGVGTLGYNKKWNLFDQIIISGNMLGSDRTTFKFWKAEVFNRDFLVAKEGQFKGHPLRTHSGNVFLNGYSDHFPVLIYLVKYAE